MRIFRSMEETGNIYKKYVKPISIKSHKINLIIVPTPKSIKMYINFVYN